MKIQESELQQKPEPAVMGQRGRVKTARDAIFLRARPESRCDGLQLDYVGEIINGLIAGVIFGGSFLSGPELKSKARSTAGLGFWRHQIPSNLVPP